MNPKGHRQASCRISQCVRKPFSNLPFATLHPCGSTQDISYVMDNTQFKLEDLISLALLIYRFNDKAESFLTSCATHMHFSKKTHYRISLKFKSLFREAPIGVYSMCELAKLLIYKCAWVVWVIESFTPWMVNRKKRKGWTLQVRFHFRWAYRKAWSVWWVITDELHHSCTGPGADQSGTAVGRFQRAAVISLHPQLSCEMLMKQTVLPLSSNIRWVHDN